MKSIQWVNNHIRLIDQRKLPGVLEFIDCYKIKDLTKAIKELSVRGAPLLGIAAAMGLALAAFRSKEKDRIKMLNMLEEASREIFSTRPTAVNLSWALKRVLKTARACRGVDEIKEKVLKEALKICKEDEVMCKKIGSFGAKLVKKEDVIITHCNAGGLATGGYGTALGVIRSAHIQGKKIKVYVDETRPLLQGSRLTAWELKQAKIPYILIADNMAGYLMKQGKVNLVIVGADRIAANGDVANKIGTYSLAVLCKENKVPFFVASPTSTVDLSIEDGKYIPIEERSAQEVIKFRNCLAAPSGSCVYNPAFDVTPNRYITGIITEAGVIYPPYKKNLKFLFPDPA